MNNNQLKLYIDFKSPGAYLAVTPSLKLAEEFGLTVDWRPINTRQEELPPEPTHSDAANEEPEDQGATHRRVRALARRQTHELYANLRDIPLTFPQEVGCTDLALATLAALDEPAEIKDRFVELAFESYWVKGDNLNDPTVVTGLLEQVGAATAVPQTDEVTTILEAATATALEDKVIDAPGYVVEEKVFIGREHLPWITSILQERN